MATTAKLQIQPPILGLNPDSNHCGGDRDRVRPTSHDSSKLDGCGRVRKVDYH